MTADPIKHIPIKDIPIKDIPIKDIPIKDIKDEIRFFMEKSVPGILRLRRRSGGRELQHQAGSPGRDIVSGGSG